MSGQDHGPLTTKGHQIGQIVSDKDAAPEFHAKVLPAGSAPAASTFKPANDTEIPGQSADNYAGEGGAGTTTSAADTITGATSADVHTGLGHPGSGQSSKELHDNSKGEGSGLQGVGAESAPQHGVDARDSMGQKADGTKDFSQVGSHGASETKVPGQKNTQ